MLSKNIKILRNEARLTKEHLAELVNVSVDEISLYEKNKKIPSEKVLKKICVYLKISYDDIISRDILSERKEALKKMRCSSNRNTYGWYVGYRKKILFSIFYLIGLLMIFSFAFLFFKNYLFKLSNTIDYYKSYWFELALLNAYLCSGIFAGIYVTIWIFIKYSLKINFIYLFLLPIIITIVVIGGCLVAIPFIFHTLYVLIIKRGRN